MITADRSIDTVEQSDRNLARCLPERFPDACTSEIIIFLWRSAAYSTGYHTQMKASVTWLKYELKCEVIGTIGSVMPCNLFLQLWDGDTTVIKQGFKA